MQCFRALDFTCIGQLYIVWVYYSVSRLTCSIVHDFEVDFVPARPEQLGGLVVSHVTSVLSVDLQNLVSLTQLLPHRLHFRDKQTHRIASDDFESKTLRRARDGHISGFPVKEGEERMVTIYSCSTWIHKQERIQWKSVYVTPINAHRMCGPFLKTVKSCSPIVADAQLLT